MLIKIYKLMHFIKKVTPPSRHIHINATFSSYTKSLSSSLPKKTRNKQPKPMNQAGIYYSNPKLLIRCRTFSMQTSRIASSEHPSTGHDLKSCRFLVGESCSIPSGLLVLQGGTSLSCPSSPFKLKRY